MCRGEGGASSFCFFVAADLDALHLRFFGSGWGFGCGLGLGVGTGPYQLRWRSGEVGKEAREDAQRSCFLLLGHGAWCSRQRSKLGWVLVLQCHNSQLPLPPQPLRYELTLNSTRAASQHLINAESSQNAKSGTSDTSATGSSS